MKDFGTAAILCGGKSRRMGFDKSEIKIKGKLLIQIIGENLEKVFNEVILISNEKDKFNNLKYRVEEDIVKDVGPMGGIHSALSYASSRYVFVTACDMPVVNTKYIEHMINIIKENRCQGVVSRNGRYLEPLCAFYSKDIMNILEEELLKNNYKVFETLNKCSIHYVNDEKVKEFSKDKRIFTNLNYIEDIALLKGLNLEE